MSLALDLLEQADHLARRDLKRPRQASLRRSVSASYYALFHLLTSDASALIAPNLPPAQASHIQRWFNHAEMKKVCGRFLAAPLAKPLFPFLGTSATSEMKVVARSFVQLQEARHSADYDTASIWTRPTAQQHVQMARYAFAAWKQIRKSPEANVFLLALLMWKNFEVER